MLCAESDSDERCLISLFAGQIAHIFRIAPENLVLMTSSPHSSYLYYALF